ncbi:MAG: hypothetical protein J4215_02215 [Candidatus Diapherotrites archaeon]|uniref:Uncharacterized protein n=1 Tax=Candidatus Iainarchaeum sp. TaxID=3101447 RepID=A0A8T4L4D3_9ARCH|nr:hypothetical protein [Candidatus Diapherotrites archaeon]
METNFLESLCSPRIFVPVVFVLFSLVFAFFFPPLPISIDEHEYARNAYLLLNGSLFDSDPVDFCGGAMVNGHYFSTYFLGKSVVLIPFVPFGIMGLMLSGLVIHLLNGILFLLILRKLKIDERLVVLYLFFPAFLWASRTLFPELLVLTFALGGTLLYLRNNAKDWFLSGLVFGLAVFVRNDAALLFSGFGLVALLSDRKKLLSMIAGFFLVGLLVMGFNTLMYGGPLQTPYGYSAGNFLAKENTHVVSNFLVFTAILLIVYPFMVLLPIVFRKKPLAMEALISTFVVLWLFSRTTDIYAYDFFSPVTITGRMRYLIPVAGLLMIPYAHHVEETLKWLGKKIHVSVPAILAVLTIGLFAGSVIGTIVHQQSLLGRQTVLDTIKQTIPEGSLTVGSSDDCIYFSKAFFGDRKYIRIDTPFLNAQNEINKFSGPVYVMVLRYSTVSGAPERQDAIDRERKQVIDFVKANSPHLEKVFESTSPHSLTIYRWIQN